jgi:predicted metal-binding protein
MNMGKKSVNTPPEVETFKVKKHLVREYKETKLVKCTKEAAAMIEAVMNISKDTQTKTVSDMIAYAFRNMEIVEEGDEDDEI